MLSSRTLYDDGKVLYMCSLRWEPHMATEHLQCGWCYVVGTELLILLISTNLYLNSHAWLMAIVLDRAAQSLWALSGQEVGLTCPFLCLQWSRMLCKNEETSELGESSVHPDGPQISPHSGVFSVDNELRHSVCKVQFSSVQSLSCVQFFETPWTGVSSTPGFPVHHQLLELTQNPVHRVSDAIQPSHPLSSPSPPSFNLSQHQGLFQWVSFSHHVAKVLEFQLRHQSFQWIFRAGFL